MKLKYLLTFLFLGLSLSIFSQEKKKIAYLKIQDVIDPRTNRYTQLGFDFAEEKKADLIIIELDTYGGALTDADEIRTRVLNSEIPVYTFINKDAASAGALISIASDSIFMASGSSIGAATVVTGEGEAAPDKYQSYMRSIMRSTAEATGRNPQIAEAMVDEDIEVDSISTQGKVITFSVSEAIKYGFCEAEVKDVQEILARSSITDYDLIEFELSGADTVISWFINPIVSGILILIIIGGIYFELQTPGVGFPILASAIAAILYFTPYYLNGLADNWEIILFFIGVILLAIEIFILPGFGVAGVLGIISILGSLVLVMLNNDGFSFDFVNPADIIKATISAFAAFVGSFILMFFMGVKLTESKIFSRIALQDVQSRQDGFTSTNYGSHLVGKTGMTYTVLRPSGKVQIDGEMYDAYSRGEYIEKDTEITVISSEGTSLKVRKKE